MRGASGGWLAALTEVEVGGCLLVSLDVRAPAGLVIAAADLWHRVRRLVRLAHHVNKVAAVVHDQRGCTGGWVGSPQPPVGGGCRCCLLGQLGAAASVSEASRQAD